MPDTGHLDGYPGEGCQAVLMMEQQHTCMMSSQKAGPMFTGQEVTI